MDVRIQTSMSADDGVTASPARPARNGDWRLHAQGRVRRLLGEPPPPVDLTALRADTTSIGMPMASTDCSKGLASTTGPTSRSCDVYLGPARCSLATGAASIRTIRGASRGTRRSPPRRDASPGTTPPSWRGRPVPAVAPTFGHGLRVVRQRSRTQRERPGHPRRREDGTVARARVPDATGRCQQALRRGTSRCCGLRTRRPAAPAHCPVPAISWPRPGRRSP